MTDQPDIASLATTLRAKAEEWQAHGATVMHIRVADLLAVRTSRRATSFNRGEKPMAETELAARLRDDFDKELRVLMDRWADNLAILDAPELLLGTLAVPLVTRLAQITALVDVRLSRSLRPTRAATEHFGRLYREGADQVFAKFVAMSESDLLAAMTEAKKRT
jgi:hypothetical protein